MNDLGLQHAHNEYYEFLDDRSGKGESIYHERVQNMIRHAEIRLIVDLNHLRVKLPQRLTSLFSDAATELTAFEHALRDFVNMIDSSYAKENDYFFVGFEGNFGSRLLNPRCLKSHHLNNLICLEGIITKSSCVHHRVVKSVHFCPNTLKSLERRYFDFANFNISPSSSSYPSKDEDGNPLETEFGLSLYQDYQTIIIQELPESAPTGQLPR